jgi:hypothetical protein
MKRVARLVAPLLIVVTLVGCGDKKDVTMPDVTGNRLDVAYDKIRDAGFDDKDKIKIEGGGTFGVIVEGNWTVCEQSPDAGETVDGAPVLTVDRSCNETEGEPSDQSSSAPSEEPSATEPALPAVLTAKNNADLAAILALGDNCDPAVPKFAEEYAGKTIRFDGSVSAFARHGGFSTRFDIMVGPGDKGANTATGPTFQFEDVNLVSDMNLTGKVGNTWGLGDKATFTAEVADYNKKTCLFHLTPVETRVR